jgi:hypothetical protein
MLVDPPPPPGPSTFQELHRSIRELAGKEKTEEMGDGNATDDILYIRPEGVHSLPYIIRSVTTFQDKLNCMHGLLKFCFCKRSDQQSRFDDEHCKV